MASVYDTLVDMETLEPHLGDPRWVVLDCRFVLSEPDSGEREYSLGHIPGAHYAHLERDLSQHKTSHSGRHPLPTPQSFQATLARWGVTPDSQVVAYDEGTSVYASRLWWLLRVFCGHKAVAVLDGGLAAWAQRGRPLVPERPAPSAAPLYPLAPIAGAWVDTDVIVDVVAGRKRAYLLDARGSDRFRGLGETFDPVAGHIPGAHNRPFLQNLDSDKRFRSSAALRDSFSDILGAQPVQEVVHYCGSGVSACHNVLAMAIAGFGITSLYPGSWSAWVSDKGRPVSRDP